MPMLDFAKLQPGGSASSGAGRTRRTCRFRTQFGVMFFPDKPRAYREVFRVLKPDGRFLFSVWDRIENNDLTFLVHKTRMKMFPEDPPMFIERTPMGYHDIGNIRGELAGAGFTQSTADTRQMPCRTPSARHPALGLIQGSPLGAETRRSNT
jgi:hypothetical protein